MPRRACKSGQIALILGHQLDRVLAATASHPRERLRPPSGAVVDSWSESIPTSIVMSRTIRAPQSWTRVIVPLCDHIAVDKKNLIRQTQCITRHDFSRALRGQLPLAAMPWRHANL